MSVTLTAAPTKLSAEYKKSRGFEPLKAGEKATYEVILSGAPEIPLNSDGRPMPARRTMTHSLRVGAYLLYDSFAETDVAMAFTRGTRPVEAAGGGQAIVPNVQEVTFTATSGGRMIVDSTNRNLFEFLEFHPLNANSLGGNVSSEPMFRRVLPTKTAQKQVNHDDQVTEARIAIKQSSTRDKVFMAELLGLPTELDGPEKDATDYGLTALLNSVANRSPSVILTANRSEAARASQLVRDLDTYNQASFDPEKSMWKMSNGTPLGGAITNGGNASQELAKWFQFSPAGIATAENLRKAIDQLKEGQTKRGPGRPPANS